MPRPVRLLLALALVVPLFAVLAAPDAAEARNRVKRRGTTITITVPVDVYLLPGAAADFPLRLQSAFDTYWGAGNAFRYRCYTVVFKLDMEVVDKLPPDDAPRHRVVVAPAPDGEQADVPHVDYAPGGHRNTRPTKDSYQGDFTDHYGIDKVWAHEFGHFMGLPDEYVDNGKQGKDRRTRPKPGLGGSLMSDGGPVQQRYIDLIVARHFPDGPPTCKVRTQLTVVTEIAVAGAGGASEGTITTVLEASATEGENGRLAGTGTYRTEGEWGGSGECTPAFAGALLYEGTDLVAEGARDGDRIELTVAGELTIATGGSVTETCVGAGTVGFDETHTTPFAYTFSGDLDDGGRYERAWTEEPSPGVSVAYQVLIEEVPADEAGEAVG